MPSARGFALLDQVADRLLTGGPQSTPPRLRSEALALVQAESLVDAAYSYEIVELDRPAAKTDPLLRVGGTTLAASRLIPESGELTALACAVATIGNRIEERISSLFAEKRPSLALALDEIANLLLFAAAHHATDQIQAEVIRRKLTLAGELRAGDPGLDLEEQGTVLRLAQAQTIGVGLTESQVMTPLKSVSLVLGVGLDLPPATWSRCDHCASRAKGKCRLWR